jgi:phospholipid/cholesterol/gamma-HCH transport system ATP-binding protein
MKQRPHIEVRDLTLAYGGNVILRDVSFEVQRSDVFVVIGGSGAGKSTLLRSLIGLLDPVAGDVCYQGESLVQADAAARERLLRRFGVLFQSGALWSSMSLAENVALPLEELTDLSRSEIDELVELKLSLVGLRGFGDFSPNELSGGMRKRAGLARAMALDPDILFFDEPSSGLDPITARRLDELMLELRASLGTTLVVVTHDLESIFAIGTDGVYLDADAKTVVARGSPRRMLEHATDPRVRQFLTRGEEV